METYTIEAQIIEAGKAHKIREAGKIPAVVYGKGSPSRSLAVDFSVFNKIYKKAGESTLIDLKIADAKPIKILIKDVQLDPVSDDIIHIDFKEVTIGEKMNVTIPLNFIGESSAVKDLNGVLITNVDELEVECLPKDLIHKIEVDISVLKTFDDVIRIKDIVVPETIAVLNNPEDAVILVSPPRVAEEEKPVSEEEAEEPEVVGKEKEEGKEGEAPKEEKKDYPAQAGEDSKEEKKTK